MFKGSQNSVENKGRKGFPRLRIKAHKVDYSSLLYCTVGKTSPMKCSGSLTPFPEGEGSFILGKFEEINWACSAHSPFGRQTASLSFVISFLCKISLARQAVPLQKLAVWGGE